MAERAGVVDIRRRELQLLGQVRRQADDLPELLLPSRQRLDFGRLRDDVRQRRELADEVRLVLDPLIGESDAVESLDEDAGVPSGILIILCTTATVPTSKRSSSRAGRPRGSAR